MSTDGTLTTPSLVTDYISRTLGNKMYELSNHLGNVISTVSDRKLAYNGTPVYYNADVLSYSDYYPFGMTMPGRNANAATYRHGFNGMEKDDELKGSGNSYDFGARIYDPRIGRWLSLDPLQAKFPQYSPYLGIGNNPIIYIDFDGRDIVYFDSDGNEIPEMRIASETEFKTFVHVTLIETCLRTGEPLEVKVSTFEEAPMPTRIETYSKYEESQKRDLNRYDHEIAALTFLFNQSLKDKTLPQKTEGAGSPSDIPKLDPNTVKSVILKETNGGYFPGSNNGDKDIMQVNVPSDWDEKKKRIGLGNGTIPTPKESINAGIYWLYWKGVTVLEVQYNEGKIVGGKVQWTGGNDWYTAVERYNGGGTIGYLDEFKAILSSLKKGESKAATKEKEKEKKKN